MSDTVNGEPQPPEEPRTLRDWLWRLKRHERRIFVCRKAGDRWVNVALADLPPDEWATHVARWLTDGSIPVRVRDSEDLSPDRTVCGADDDDDPGPDTEELPPVW